MESAAVVPTIKCKLCHFEQPSTNRECAICNKSLTSKKRTASVNGKKTGKTIIENVYRPLSTRSRRQVRAVGAPRVSVYDENVALRQEHSIESVGSDSRFSTFNSHKQCTSDQYTVLRQLSYSSILGDGLSAMGSKPSISQSNTVGSFQSALFRLPKQVEEPSGTLSQPSSSYFFASDTEQSVSLLFDCVPVPPSLTLRRPTYIPHKKLDLTRWPVSDSTIEMLCETNPNLVDLNVKGSIRLTDRGLSILGKNQPDLRHLNLEGCTGLQLTHGIGTLLASCQRLRTLNLSRVPAVSNVNIRYIAKNATNLRSFSCDDSTGMNDETITLISDILKLEYLSLKGCAGILGKTLGLLLKKCHRLKHLFVDNLVWINDKSLSSISAQKIAWGYTDAQGGLLPLATFSGPGCVRIGDGGITWLASKTRQILEINLSNNELITDVSIHLIGKWCSKLAKLNVSNCPNLTDKGLQKLAECQKEHNRNAFLDGGSTIGLQLLDLSQCTKVSDIGICSICQVLPNIRTLKLQGLPFLTDLGAFAIAKNCRLAEDIDFSDCACITDEGINAIVTQVRTCTTNGFSITEGKTARQSTTLACRDASIAVNGSCRGAYGNSYDDADGDISQTTFEHQPWWEVDLSELWDVGILRIWSPTMDDMIAYNFPMWVLASAKPFGDDKVNASVNVPGVYKRCFKTPDRCIKWDIRQNIRYIRVQTTNSAPLLLAQVEAFFRGSIKLRLQGCTGLTGEGYASVARRFLHLTHLDVSKSETLDNTSLILMARNLHNLERLNLSGSKRITDEGMYEWSLLPRKIEELDVSRCSNLTCKSVLYVLSRCPGMVTMKLSYIEAITDSAVYFIGRMSPLLETLTLHGCPLITDAGIIRVSPLVKYACPENNFVSGGFDFFPRVFASCDKYRDEIEVSSKKIEVLITLLQRRFRAYLTSQDRHKQNQAGGTHRIEETGEDEESPCQFLTESSNPATAIYDFDTESNTSQRKMLSEKQRKQYLQSVSAYSNASMFEIAKERGRREREQIRRALNKIGKNYQARLIQRSWRRYVKRCEEIERRRLEMLEYNKQLGAILMIQRRIRIRIAKRKVDQLRRDRLAYIIWLRSQNVELSKIDPALQREFASMVIQKYARIFLEKMAVEKARMQAWIEKKAGDTIKRGLLRLIMRARGRRILKEKRRQKMEKIAIRIQAQWRGRMGRDDRRAMTRAASKIERLMIKRVEWKRYLLDCRMASRIQKLTRGIQGRVEYRRRLHEKYRSDCSNRIQYKWRSYRARKTIAVLKIQLMLKLQRERWACKRLQRWIKGRNARYRFLKVLKITHLRIEGATIVIQRWMWEYCFPHAMTRRIKAARVIQKMCRARLFRWRLGRVIRHRLLMQQLELERWEEWQHLEAMALRVQCSWRQKKAREWRRFMVQERTRRLGQMNIIRKMQDLQNYMEIVQRRAIQNAAATKIERIARGYLGRRLYQVKLEKHKNSQKIAAMQIQSQIRAKYAAKLILKMKLAVQAVAPRVYQERGDANAETAIVEGSLAQVMAKKFDLKTAKERRAKELEYKNNPLRVGSIVSANWGGRQRWFRGKVLRINPPGHMYENLSYKIQYVDNYIEKRVPREWIKLLRGETELWTERPENYIFITNIPPQWDKERVRMIFEGLGVIEALELSSSFPLFAFVNMQRTEDVAPAIEALDGYNVNTGKRLQDESGKMDKGSEVPETDTERQTDATMNVDKGDGETAPRLKVYLGTAPREDESMEKTLARDSKVKKIAGEKQQALDNMEAQRLREEDQKRQLELTKLRISNIPPEWTLERVAALLPDTGDVDSMRFCTEDPETRPREAIFNMTSYKSAGKAMDALDGYEVDRVALKVTQEVAWTDVQIKNIPESWSDEQVRGLLEDKGEAISLRRVEKVTTVGQDITWFVKISTHAGAEKVVESLNGSDAGKNEDGKKVQLEVRRAEEVQEEGAEAEAGTEETEEDKAEAKEEKDPVLIEYDMVTQKRMARGRFKKLVSHIPFSSLWWRERQIKEELEKIATHRAKHAIYTRSKVSTKIRVGIDDVLIILGVKENAIMAAAQRRQMRSRRAYYECIDVDLRANIRLKTNDELPVYVWYRKSTKPRLVVEIKIAGSYMFDGANWNEYRKQGFERVFSNESKEIPKPGHWTRLPFTIWIRKAVYENPIDDIMVSRFTRTRMEQRACMERGFLQMPVDLSNFGMDYGLRFWYKYMQEFHDEINLEHELTEKAKEQFRGLNGIPPDIDPAYLADQAGDPAINAQIREVVEFIGLPDSAVVGLYKAFRRLAKSDVNTEIYVTVDELFHALGLRFGGKEFGPRFIEMMWDVAKLPVKDNLYFVDFVKLCGIWCIMGRRQILLTVFNSQDPMKDGVVPFEKFPELIWDLHKESLEYRKRSVKRLLADRVTPEEFIKDGSGKWQFSWFQRMDTKFPQLLYPLFYFQWSLCDKTLGLSFWEKQRAHLYKYSTEVVDEVKEHEAALAEKRFEETQAALTRATLKDSVKAILTNKPLPEGATENTILLAHKRVKKLKKQADKLHVDINVLADKMK